MATLTPVRHLGTPQTPTYDVRVICPSPPQMASPPIGTISRDDSNAREAFEDLITAIESSQDIAARSSDHFGHTYPGPAKKTRPSLRVKPLSYARQQIQTSASGSEGTLKSGSIYKLSANSPWEQDPRALSSPQFSPSQCMPLEMAQISSTTPVDLRAIMCNNWTQASPAEARARTDQHRTSSQRSPVDSRSPTYQKWLTPQASPKNPNSATSHLKDLSSEQTPIERGRKFELSPVESKHRAHSKHKEIRTKSWVMDPRKQNCVKKYRPNSSPIRTKCPQIPQIDTQSRKIQPQRPPQVALAPLRGTTPLVSPMDLNRLTPSSIDRQIPQSSPLNPKFQEARILQSSQPSEKTPQASPVDPRLRSHNVQLPTSSVPVDENPEKRKSSLPGDSDHWFQRSAQIQERRIQADVPRASSVDAKSRKNITHTSYIPSESGSEPMFRYTQKDDAPSPHSLPNSKILHERRRENSRGQFKGKSQNERQFDNQQSQLGVFASKGHNSPRLLSPAPSEPSMIKIRTVNISSPFSPANSCPEPESSSRNRPIGLKRAIPRDVPIGSRPLGSSIQSNKSFTGNSEMVALSPLKLPIPRPSSTLTSPFTHLDYDGKVPNYSPVDFRDLGYVDLWLDQAETANSSPLNSPTSPIFSDNEVSTAPSSPMESQKSQDSLDLHWPAPGIPARQDSTLGGGKITRFGDLDNCTPQFVQACNQLKENRRSASPEDYSPSSEYSDDVERTKKSPYHSSNQGSLPPKKSHTGISTNAASILRKISDTEVLTDRAPPQARLLKHSTISPLQETSPTQRKVKPHVTQLIIPLSPPGDIKLVENELHGNPDDTALRYTLKTREEKDEENESFDEALFNNLLAQVQTPAMRRSAPVGGPAEKLFGTQKSWGPPSAIVAPPSAAICTTGAEEMKSARFPEDYSPSFKIPASASFDHEDEDLYNVSPVMYSPPVRLTKPIRAWTIPGFFASKEGMQLRISRRVETMSKIEWVIESVRGDQVLKCFARADSSSRKKEFLDMDGNHIFKFEKTTGSTQVAETNNGCALFVVRNASLHMAPHWTITHKTGTNDESSMTWVATGDSSFKHVIVLWGGFLVGRIEMEDVHNELLNHTYIVTINPEMNYCMMAALTTVFDDFRVNEGLF